MRLGRLLARAGHTVVTGGYIGTMEAVSRGACEEAGHTIGVTCDEIEAWRPVRPNAWVREEWRSSRLLMRIERLVTGCDAAIVLPGGAGTLAELALMWNLMLVQVIPVRPLILVGHGWRMVFDALLGPLGPYVPGPARELIAFAGDVEEAVQRLTVFAGS